MLLKELLCQDESLRELSDLHVLGSMRSSACIDRCTATKEIIIILQMNLLLKLGCRCLDRNDSIKFAFTSEPDVKAFHVE